MLTINYNGKTYTTTPHTQADNSVNYTIERFIDKGYLEEVEEKTEEKRTPQEIMELVHNRPYPTASVTVSPAEYEDMKKAYESAKDTSILEKLREELDRRVHTLNSGGDYNNGFLHATEEILDVLNDLTK